MSAANLLQRKYTPRENEGGNFCGHNPAFPRFVLDENPYEAESKEDGTGCKRRARILYKTTEKIKSYYKDTDVIPTLAAVNNSTRRQRSERREACIALMEALILNMDIASMRVGYPSRDGFQNYSLEWLANTAKISFSRAKRALSDLKKSGIITVKQAREFLDDGSFKGLNAVKRLSEAFFQVLGLSAWLKMERKKSSKFLRKKAAKEGMTQKQMGNYKMLMNGLNNTDKPTKRRKADKQASEEQIRLNRLIGEVAHENPDLSGDEIRELAKSRL